MNGGTLRGFTDPSGVVGGVRVPYAFSRTTTVAAPVASYNAVQVAGAAVGPAMTAANGIFTPLFSLTGGRGMVDILMLNENNNVGYQFQIFIDGTRVMNLAGVANNAVFVFGSATDSAATGANLVGPQPVYFEQEFRILIAGSGGTTSVRPAIRYELHK